MEDPILDHPREEKESPATCQKVLLVLLLIAIVFQSIVLFFIFSDDYLTKSAYTQDADVCFALRRPTGD